MTPNTTDPKYQETTTADMPLYRVLGGYRLRYEVNLPSGAEDVNITWQFDGQAGRFCDTYGVDAEHEQDDGCEPAASRTITGDERSIYWEPEDWTTGVAATGTVTANYKLGGEQADPFEKQFQVQSRLLKPVADDPMKGQDVKMLETVLWQLGLSPQRGSPGSEGARIDSHRGHYKGNDLGWTKDCNGAEVKLRDTYLVGWSNCSSSEVSMEAMVRRFQARNLDTGTLVTEREVGATSGGVDGIVGDDTLGWLYRDWALYWTAYSDLKKHGVYDQHKPEMDGWIDEAVLIWEEGSGTTVDPTLTSARYTDILDLAGIQSTSHTRAALLRAWLEEEAPYHWGANIKEYQATPYRMTEGGADENGSLSFSQLLYHYRYGPTPCAAHEEAGENLYNPRGNLRTMVIHSSANDTTLANTKKCEGGLYEGFVEDSLRVTYGNGSTATNEPMTELRGYQHPGATLETAAITDDEDDYEVLAKSIAKYNGSGPDNGNWFSNRSWPRLLRYLEYDPASTRNTPTVCHSCRYSLSVRAKENVFADHLRGYIWYGGTYPDDHATNPGEEWCFAYGEKEWRNPFTYINDEGNEQAATFERYRLRARAIDDFKIPCE